MSKDWIDRDVARVWHGFTQMATYADNEPVIVERAEGHYLIGADGKRYLDAISSLWVTTLGHKIPELDAALTEQLGKVAHSTLLGNGSTTVIELAEALAEVVPVSDPHLMFASDGAAAVEQALKMAFQYWTNQGVSGRTSYLTFGGAYHGDTVGSLSLGADGFGSDTFDPLRFPVLRAPAFDAPDCMAIAADMIRTDSERLAAVVVEPYVQGAAGIKIHPSDGFAILQEACDDTGVLLICDEVATGFGRTGTLFASQRCGLTPDIMTLGKGITGGYLPMSVTISNHKVHDTFLGEDLSDKTLYHGHSYGGNALAAAVALRHLRLMSEWNVLDNVVRRSEQLQRRLAEKVSPLSIVKDVRVAGLMCGVELAEQHKRGRRVCATTVRSGVLLRPLGNVIAIVPLLTSTEDEIETIVDVLADAISQEEAS
jgi:adenosylmethionine---8-amino-7-oxononanoate aminotransferase